ncbi:multicopper oxidase [Xylariaceae sp. FL0594]|nr:multicopper oxidase [Xylariaceae sp. FL0594]
MMDRHSSGSVRAAMMSEYEDDGGLSLLPSFTPEGRRPRTVPLCLFVASVVCFGVVAVALAFALGLSVGLERWPRHGNFWPTTALIEYDTYYRIPHDLEIIGREQLINAEELGLNTGFAVRSGQPQTREYVFNVTQALAAPDGFLKPMILVNNQSPGPLIEANSGDTIRVRVFNLMANGSTSIHWHGIDQKNTTWVDGVTGVSQCGIPPRRDFTYEFRLDGQRGTFWWHAHTSIQYSDGLYGPIVIHDPDEIVPKTDDERIIFVGDVYHTYGPVLLESYLNSTSKWVPFESGVEPLPDNILLNGQNTYDCAIDSTTYPTPSPAEHSPQSSTGRTSCDGGQAYTTKVRTGQRVRVRLINSSSFLSYWFSIDNHTISVVELDGVEISPLAARGVYLNIGQRASVVVTADQTPGNYHSRATLPRTCFLPYAPYTSAGLASGGYAVQGILSYDVVDPGEGPVGAAGNVSNAYGVETNGVRGDVWEGCDDMPFDMPKPMREVAAYDVPEENKQYIEYAFRQAQNINRIFINKASLIHPSLPPLREENERRELEQKFVASEANAYNSWNFGLDQQVLLIPEADKGAQIVINSQDVMEHPWHLHGMGARHPPSRS